MSGPGDKPSSHSFFKSMRNKNVFWFLVGTISLIIAYVIFWSLEVAFFDFCATHECCTTSGPSWQKIVYSFSPVFFLMLWIWLTKKTILEF